jgi:hypothetical protein
MGFILTDPEFYSPRSIGVENANDAGEVACNKPEAQAKQAESGKRGHPQFLVARMYVAPILRP